MRRSLIGGGILVAIVAGVLAVGLASAQTDTPTPTISGSPDNLADKFKTELASQLGISVDQLNTALTGTQNALIDQAVADGKLTQAEADKLKSNINDDNNLFPFRGLGERIKHHLKGAFVSEAATVLNVDESVITDGLQSGQSLAQIANDHGMSTDDFKTALLAQVKTDLDTKVADGDITQTQADRLYNGLTDHIDDLINHVPGEFPKLDGEFHFGDGHGRGFRFNFGGPDDDSAPNAPSTSGTPETSITF